MATKKKITRKVLPKPVVKTKEVAKEDQQPQVDLQTVRSKKGCLFCQKKTNPSYVDLASLRRFITDRAKIVGKEKSNVCSKHQRAVAKNIKYARHLGLLPFIPKV